MLSNVKSWLPLAVLTTLTTLVSADIEFTSPKAGAKIKGGTAIVVEWKDSGDSPAISDLTTYNLFLCYGGNEPGTFKQVLAITSEATFAVTGNKATGTLGTGLAPDTPTNAYFLQMISTAAKGGTVQNFSPRFSLTGMDDVTIEQEFIDGAKEAKGTEGPDTIDATSDGGPADPKDGDYEQEYTMQTGPTRYAPMQPVPPTKITKKEAKPLFPTSGFNIAKSFLPNPKQQTTITRSQTFSVSTRENTVAAASMPTDDMEKFLARWKD